MPDRRVPMVYEFLYNYHRGYYFCAVTGKQILANQLLSNINKLAGEYTIVATRFDNIQYTHEFKAPIEADSVRDFVDKLRKCPSIRMFVSK